jgi:hypothetical protein
LIWAARDGEYFVVHYERGGIGHSYHVLVARFKAKDSKAEPLWRGVELGGPLKDYKAFLDAIESNSIRDESGK